MVMKQTVSLGVIVRRAMREPLIQFIALGGLLFLSTHVIAEHRDSSNKEIVVDHSVSERIAKLYEMQTGTSPSAGRLEALVDEYIRDEILYREAKKIGLDQNDEIIKRRLTQKLDFLQRDLAVIPEPTDDQLRSYYSSHAAEFTSPETVTFTHIYFNPDHGGSDAARARAVQVLTTMAPAASERAPQLGDTFPLRYDYVGLTKEEATQLFGQTPIVDSVFASESGRWLGPFQSGYGWHLVYVYRKKEAALIAFDDARDRVHQAYIDKARAEANERKFEQLKSEYVVARLDQVAQ